jgi:hypothetical protein
MHTLLNIWLQYQYTAIQRVHSPCLGCTPCSPFEFIPVSRLAQLPSPQDEGSIRPSLLPDRQACHVNTCVQATAVTELLEYCRRTSQHVLTPGVCWAKWIRHVTALGLSRLKRDNVCLNPGLKLSFVSHFYVTISQNATPYPHHRSHHITDHRTATSLQGHQLPHTYTGTVLW